MDRHGTKHVDIPKWSALLVEAVNKPGMIMEAYSAFHQYSIGNQILALVQCQLRGLEPGPINTFPGWQALGRTVKRGERALILCMPITRKVRDDQESNGEASEVLGVLLVIAGVVAARSLHLSEVTPWSGVAVLLPTGFAYYAVWRWGVAFLNSVLAVDL
jgi:N-terminal domain of anti-restriction factor ArdC